ncbi:hypothetical protein KSP40_PGU004394 [Platanthera guangdongensis]|uniref:Uncharacterized protein n=1 Tax=Platanthera guangdongensis TaxID=2320717 RepID=A0ABR2N3X4_9ASPA
MATNYCSLLNTTIPLMAKSSMLKTRALILRNGRVELETTAASSLKTFSQLNKASWKMQSGEAQA